MKRSFASSALFALVLLVAVPDAEAQAQIELGPRVGYEIDDIDALKVGADVRVSTFALPVKLNGTFDYYFVDEDDFALGDDDIDALSGAESFLQFTANGLYEFGINNQVFTPYAGPGLSVTRVSYIEDAEEDNNTDVGLNLVGGAEFGVSNLKAFVQAEFVVGGDVEPAAITGGLLFSIGQ